jgi:hypothetical protein
MKRLIITIAVVIITVIACKKDKGRKCYWDIVINNQIKDSRIDKPAPDQLRKIEDTCSCVVSVKENCFSCDITVTTQGGFDVPCR